MDKLLWNGENAAFIAGRRSVAERDSNVGKAFSRRNLPFVWGAQYYRAPTPGPEHWERDFQLAAEAGMTDLKFWVQWRASARAGQEYHFDDVDALMDRADAAGFRATINIVYDVIPQWVLAKHPECLMVTQAGQAVRPVASASRQIGGYPGPCLNHPGAREARMDFTRAVLLHYRSHPALFMWDVWNEPEQCAPYRQPDVRTLTCYCPVCQELFKRWLADKYGDIARLNAVWGRMYDSWGDVETPLAVDGLMNMVDWRLFMLDTITNESAWRIEMARELDPNHAVYTHVVPTVAQEGWGFNQITCTDDFALGAQGDIFAGTVNRFPVMGVKVTSAAGGKVCYNVESHLNGGGTAWHPRLLDLHRLAKEFLIQIGQGIRGFMYWQFHAESLGKESPAWGLVDPGGRPKLAHASTKAFHEAISPHFEDLMRVPPPEPEVGIYLAAGNEIFQWCIGLMDDAGKSIAGYTEMLFWSSIPCCYVPTSRVNDEGLAGLKVLILPQAYLLSRAEADAIGRWIRAGGLLIAEAHTAGYDATTGRHSGVIPGCGLAEVLGLCEVEPADAPAQATDAPTGQAPPAKNIQQDVLVAMGRTFSPHLVGMRLAGKEGITFGHKRCTGLEGGDGHVVGRFLNGTPAIVARGVGGGAVVYAGTNFGPILADRARAVGEMLVGRILQAVGAVAGLTVSGHGRAHLDMLAPEDGASPMFILIAEGGPLEVSWDAPTPLKSRLSGMEPAPRAGRVTCRLEGDFADLLVPVG